jgi:hypothetical protein
MSILPSKTQMGQVVSVLENRESTSRNKLKAAQPQVVVDVIAAQGSAIQPIKRLIVLVPDVEMDEVQIAREVWEMAAAPNLAVLLFSLCNDTSEELQIQRRLINLAALIRDPRITVESQIEYGKDWLRSVESVLDDGDVILCHREQEVGWMHKPLVNVLSVLHTPVWTLSGIYPKKSVAYPRWLVSAGFWVVAMAILAGFFYLQSQINMLPDGVAKNVMLCLSVLVEIGSLYFCNSIFN